MDLVELEADEKGHTVDVVEPSLLHMYHTIV